MQMQMLKTTLTLTMYNPTVTSYHYILKSNHGYHHLSTAAFEATLGRFDNDDADTITNTNACSVIDTGIDNDEVGQSRPRRNDGDGAISLKTRHCRYLYRNYAMSLLKKSKPFSKKFTEEAKDKSMTESKAVMGYCVLLAQIMDGLVSESKPALPLMTNTNARQTTTTGHIRTHNLAYSF
ncbi:7438_t:CDS:2 [Paraglomus brasilianum]|uniref:7438_t:CDS:1 n=1 Tax=Paraglomus brasilianum TaxID=144538 RepID=A0A9N9G6S3_9GLOM|nr:7438_t:CDS:2 [Paraglomus brasilianum]